MPWLLFLLACATPARTPAPQPPVAEPVRVHLTIDDAPWMIERSHRVPLQASEVAERNQALMRVLAERSVRASVFFNCGRLQPGDTTVEAWHAGGHTVGNHTHSHAPLNRIGPEAWLDDARLCHEELERRLDSPVRWLRYPYLGYGDGQEARDAATAGLAVLGERTAPVTVATTEWLHAYTYRRALRLQDDGLKAEVVADYHQHMDDALRAGREAAQEFPGREVVQVVLVHLNELAIDELGPLIDRWTAQGVRFVDLDTAMADPVFAMENRFTGTSGISWLWRIREPDAFGPYWFGREEARVTARFGAIDPADMGVVP